MSSVGDTMAWRGLSVQDGDLQRRSAVQQLYGENCSTETTANDENIEYRELHQRTPLSGHNEGRALTAIIKNGRRLDVTDALRVRRCKSSQTVASRDKARLPCWVTTLELKPHAAGSG